MNDIYLMIGSYVGVLIIMFFVMNFISGGLIVPLLRVKTSRGRLILIRVRDVPADYFVAGSVFEGFIVYKDLNKNRRRLAFPGKNCITRSLGVNCIDVDDEKNSIVMPDFSVVTGFDPVKFDNLITRALMAAQPQDKLLIIVLICVAIGALASVVSAIMLFNLGDKIDALYQISSTVVTATTG